MEIKTITKYVVAGIEYDTEREAYLAEKAATSTAAIREHVRKFERILRANNLAWDRYDCAKAVIENLEEIGKWHGFHVIEHRPGRKVFVADNVDEDARTYRTLQRKGYERIDMLATDAAKHRGIFPFR